MATPEQPVEPIEADEAIAEYLRGAYSVIEALYQAGIITIDQAEAGRMERFDWAHDTFNVEIIGDDIDGNT